MDRQIIYAMFKGAKPAERKELPGLEEADPLWDMMVSCWLSAEDRPSMTSLSAKAKTLVHRPLTTEAPGGPMSSPANTF